LASSFKISRPYFFDPLAKFPFYNPVPENHHQKHKFGKIRITCFLINLSFGHITR
jgi:hypothetical protein